MLRATLITALLITTPASAQMVDAAQIRPILDATKANWIAVREWEGQDLLYFSHLEAWRCGLSEVRYGINTDTADTIWNIAECDESIPNAIPEGHIIYTNFDLKSVETVVIELIYDDGTTDRMEYERAAIQIQ